MNAVLFYDGSCPLCAREIGILRKQVSSGLVFADVHSADLQGVPKEDMLKRLHLQKPDGSWLIGLDANVYAWSFTRFGLAFRLLRLWPIQLAADRIYEGWADRRYNKRYGCTPCQ